MVRANIQGFNETMFSNHSELYTSSSIHYRTNDDDGVGLFCGFLLLLLCFCVVVFFMS